jgi:hypothetical protein
MQWEATERSNYTHVGQSLKLFLAYYENMYPHRNIELVYFIFMPPETSAKSCHIQTLMSILFPSKLLVNIFSLTGITFYHYLRIFPVIKIVSNRHVTTHLKADFCHDFVKNETSAFKLAKTCNHFAAYCFLTICLKYCNFKVKI